jgi:hypothetical protein
MFNHLAIYQAIHFGLELFLLTFKNIRFYCPFLLHVLALNHSLLIKQLHFCCRPCSCNSVLHVSKQVLCNQKVSLCFEAGGNPMKAILQPGFLDSVYISPEPIHFRMLASSTQKWRKITDWYHKVANV